MRCVVIKEKIIDIFYRIRYGWIIRYWIVRKDKRIAYLKMSRAGSTVIMNCMKGDEEGYYVHTKINYVNTLGAKINSNSIVDGYIGQLPCKMLEYFKFTYVRNPLERLVSTYEMYLHGVDPSNGWFTNYLYGYIKKDEGFEKFIRKICKIPAFLLDTHLTVQSNIIYKNKSPLVDYIGKFEELDKDFMEGIVSKFGLFMMPESSRDKKKYAWQDYYTIELAWMVFDKYRVDFENFGYVDDFFDLIRYLENKESNKTSD